MHEMIIKQVGVNKADGHPIVLLKERHGERVMPIWIGEPEFRAIAIAMSDIAPHRPLTHDLMINSFEAMGRKLTSVHITCIADSTFHAELCLMGNKKKKISIDCRPSDGIALAVLAKAAIMVAPSVLDSAGYLEDEKHEQDSQKFKEFLSTLKASDFGSLKADDDNADRPNECPDKPAEE